MYEMSARKLKQMLFEMGWNKSQLARQLNVSPQTIHQWEKGVTRPNGLNLTKLAEVSGRPENWFFSDEVEVSAPSAPDNTGEFGELSEKEKRLLHVFRKFPDAESNNMLLAFEMRLKELQDYYTRYTNPERK